MSEQMPWQDFKQAIAQLSEQGKYQELLDHFKANKASFQGLIAADTFILRYMLKALRKSGHARHIFSFLAAYGTGISEKTNKYLLNEYGWGLLDNLKNSGHHTDDHGFEEELLDLEVHENPSGVPDHPRSELTGKIEEFLKLVTGLKDGFFDQLVSTLFSTVIKAEKKRPTPNWKFLSGFCDIFDPDMLSTECKTIQTPHLKKKTTELASDRESWYAAKTKALYSLQEYRLCLELSEKALEAFPKFHYSNDAWFARWIALSLSQLGNTEEAIAKLKEILKRKREWFIQKELAELYYKTGNLDEALKLGLEGMNNFGELKYKVGLLRLLGTILKNKQQNELTFQHLSLSKLIRRHESWGIPGALLAELDSFGLPEIPWSGFDNLKRKLKVYWAEQGGSTPVRQANGSADHGNAGLEARNSGVIQRILNDNERGKFGFVLFDGDKQAAFNIPPQAPIHPKIQVGVEIEFNPELMPDGKHRAKNIRLKN